MLDELNLKKDIKNKETMYKKQKEILINNKICAFQVKNVRIKNSQEPSFSQVKIQHWKEIKIVKRFNHTKERKEKKEAG